MIFLRYSKIILLGSALLTISSCSYVKRCFISTPDTNSASQNQVWLDNEALWVNNTRYELDQVEGVEASLREVDMIQQNLENRLARFKDNPVNISKPIFQGTKDSSEKPADQKGNIFISE